LDDLITKGRLLQTFGTVFYLAKESTVWIGVYTLLEN